MIKILAIQIVTKRPFPSATSYEIASLPYVPRNHSSRTTSVSVGKAQASIDAMEKGLP